MFDLTSNFCNPEQFAEINIHRSEQNKKCKQHIYVSIKIYKYYEGGALFQAGDGGGSNAIKHGTSSTSS